LSIMTFVTIFGSLGIPVISPRILGFENGFDGLSRKTKRGCLFQIDSPFLGERTR
jgi:hypothetical protein